MPAVHARTALPALGVVLLLAGCGTTVSGVTAANQQLGTVDGGLAAPGAPTTAGALGGATSGGNLSVPGSTVGSVAGGGSTSGTGGAVTPGTGTPRAGGTAPATVASGVNGPGVTDKAIYVGIGYTTNGDAANAAIGADAITQGDTKADAQAVIDDINAHGGVAGRKLVPVFHPTNAQSQQTKATQDQEACSDYTEDHKVLATTDIGYTNTFMDCMTKAQAVIVTSTMLNADDEYFRQYPYYVDMGTLSQDRANAALVTSLQRQDWFSPWNASLGKPGTGPVKIGVLGVDVPEWTRPVNRVLLPALKAAGHPVDPDDVAMVYNPASTAEDSITLRDIANAALKFRQDGVTHVILLDIGGQLLTFFGQDANSQHYYPRYGVHSGSGVQGIYDAGLVTNQQLNGMAGLSWNPALDLTAAAGEKYANDATRHCLKVMKDRTGQTFDSTNAAAIALSYCDEIYFLAYAIDHAGPVLNRDTVMAAVEATKFGFLPASYPNAFFGPGRHDAVETGWDQVWDSSCRCTKYATKPYRIP